MCGCVEKIKCLYDMGLYSNVIKLAGQSLAAFEQKNLSLSWQDKYSLTFLYADSLFKTSQYSAAEHYFRQIITPSKHGKNHSNKDEPEDVDNDAELKYKIHLCCLKQKNEKRAMQILQTVVPRLRTAKINMALADLYKKNGMDRAAIACYKEVLKECPAAIEAMENMLELGMQGVEVNMYTVDLVSDMPWLNIWLKANAELYTGELSQALQTFQSLDTSKMLKNCPSLLIKIAYVHHYLGDEKKALEPLLRIQKQHNYAHNFGRDLLGTLLGNNPTSENLRRLESLCTDIQASNANCDDWVIMGNHMYATKKYDAAARFAKQALMKERNVEALLLEVRSLIELGKYQEASLSCSEALKLCQYRLDLHQCLVECHVKMNRLREADNVAHIASMHLKGSAEVLTLQASVLMKYSVISRKTIKKTLETAVEKDKQLKTNALYMLAELLEQDEQWDEAKQLLEKYEKDFPTSKLHQMLGDICSYQQKSEEAFNHYDIALRLDPNNQTASEGLNCLGRCMSVNKRDNSYLTAGESSFLSQGTSDGDNFMAEGSINITPHTSFYSV